jgi:hypothetical protein
MNRAHPSRQKLSSRFLLPALFAVLACRTLTPATPTPAPTALPSATPTPSPTATPTLLPSAIPSPSPTLTPTITPTPEPKLLYSEIFEDETTCFNLHTFQDGVELGIEDGAYFIRVAGADNGFNTICTPGFHDFYMELDLTITEGGEHSVAAVYFRQFTNSSYTFYLTGDHFYCLDYYDFASETGEALAGCWRPTFLPNRQPIHVTIAAWGGNIALLLNGELMALTEHFANDYGRFGLIVFNTGEGITEARFDNIIIRELAPADLEIFTLGESG